MVYCEVCTEVSGTAEVCTDEQKLDKRHTVMDKVAQFTKVQRLPKLQYVDSAGVNLKGICLAEGELSRYVLTGEQSAEVIVIVQTSSEKSGRSQPTMKD